MKIIKFTIKGNHKSMTGNPLPKLKMTGNQSWTEKAQEYIAWKDHVARSFIESIEDQNEKKSAVFNMARFNKPVVKQKSDHMIMEMVIMWSGKAHGDPENIFGSIADAIFENDKNLDPWVLSMMSKNIVRGKPAASVSCVIRFFESEAEKIEYANKHLTLS